MFIEGQGIGGQGEKVEAQNPQTTRRCPLQKPAMQEKNHYDNPQILHQLQCVPLHIIQ